MSVDGNNPFAVERFNSLIQINCLMPKGGVGFFVTFPEDKEFEAFQAASALLKQCPLPENIDLTSKVAGSIAAGTMPKPKFKVG